MPSAINFIPKNFVCGQLKNYKKMYAKTLTNFSQYIRIKCIVFNFVLFFFNFYLCVRFYFFFKSLFYVYMDSRADQL